MTIALANKIVSASDDDLTPQNVAEWAKGTDPRLAGYMLAKERHRRGLPVKPVEAK